MADRISVRFGSTKETVDREVLKLCEQHGWDRSRVCYVLDLDASGAKETVYVVSDRSADLPMHPSGASAVQKLDV